MIEITSDNFDQEVLKGSLVFVDCYADWCSPCKALKPVLSELEDANQVKLTLLDVDKNPDLAARLKVASIPKVVVFRDGEEVTSVSGLHPKSDYQEIIDDLK